jgi:putative flippase GtrA
MPMPPSLDRTGSRLSAPMRLLMKEIAAFGVIGILNLILDTVLFNVLLASNLGLGPNKASLISTCVTTLLAYFGNRHLSFSHRARTGFARESMFFFGVNFVALGFSQIVIAIFSYPLGQQDNTLTMNIVRLGTIAIGTVFRFWAYKRFVFLELFESESESTPASAPSTPPTAS